MKYLNALRMIGGVGPKTLWKLHDSLPSFEAAWKASSGALLQAGIGEKLSERVCSERRRIDPDREWDNLRREGISMTTILDDSYPQLLKEIPDAPFLLYEKGSLDIDSQPAISVVGSRKYSRYGSQAAESLVRELSDSGILIVSGMALGIDSIAHRTALSRNRPTVAILGNSLDEASIYPRSNVGLFKEIESQGKILSEYPVPTPAGKGTFPARNRLIAGLSLGTLVIEAGEKSGSLITSSLALDYGREVFAVPGSIFSPESRGTNNLIQKGAKLIVSSIDILEEIGLESLPREKDFEGASEEEKRIIQILSEGPLHIDKLSKISKLGTMTVSATLSLMEIKGWIRNIGGGNYIII